MRRRFSLFSMLLCLGCFIVMLFTTACRQPSSSSSQTQAPSHVVDVPDFNADSAFAYVERQVAFGPRVPNTPAHRNAAEYLTTELRRHGAQVVLQDFRVRAYDGTMLDACNIIASYSPEKKDRVLLFAHWDTRPYADNDPQQKNHRLPIDGANDGASGVAVLLGTGTSGCTSAQSPRIRNRYHIFRCRRLWPALFFRPSPSRVILGRSVLSIGLVDLIIRLIGRVMVFCSIW